MSHLTRKPTICICETKDADQLRGNREADQRLCFHYRIVQFLYFQNPKFPVFSHLLCLYRPVCVGPVRKPHCWFSHEAAQMWMVIVFLFYNPLNSLGHMSRLVGKLTMWFPTRPDINRPVQLQKQTRSLKFWS